MVSMVRSVFENRREKGKTVTDKRSLKSYFGMYCEQILVSDG